LQNSSSGFSIARTAICLGADQWPRLRPRPCLRPFVEGLALLAIDRQRVELTQPGNRSRGRPGLPRQPARRRARPRRRSPTSRSECSSGQCRLPGRRLSEVPKRNLGALSSGQLSNPYHHQPKSRFTRSSVESELRRIASYAPCSSKPFDRSLPRSHSNVGPSGFP
jgi:hypothetical protein